jgi:hypothetical protein
MGGLGAVGGMGGLGAVGGMGGLGAVGGIACLGADGVGGIAGLGADGVGGVGGIAGLGADGVGGIACLGGVGVGGIACLGGVGGVGGVGGIGVGRLELELEFISLSTGEGSLSKPNISSIVSVMEDPPAFSIPSNNFVFLDMIKTKATTTNSIHKSSFFIYNLYIYNFFMKKEKKINNLK